ncbi:MAG: 16S rRNA (guanine(527)-N(7))-methyltransferase RsmG, partial [Spirochaetaceae bacterium]|nr:16S rRNA (guanine(527)-N(7))-methyltransferase RsmG [Spirochaetaceae bacterium]
MGKLIDGLEALCLADKITAALIEGRLPLIAAALLQYIEEIERFNPAYGLVKTADRDELIVKHILDSLAPLPYLEHGSFLADVGSGAGFPGIPLAICLPGVQVTLIERMGRRAGFLQSVLAVLGLSNCKVEETEMENAVPGRFDTVTFRAFHPLTPELLKRLFRLLVSGGRLAAYKGRRDKTEAELAAAGLSGGFHLIPLSVPFLDEERHLALIPRVASKENLAEKSVPLPAAGRSKVEILAKGFSRNLVRRN